MALRFTTQTALCLMFSVIACATAANADNGYFPYYEQNRDQYQFSNVMPPIQNNAVAPVPASSPVTIWQPPQQMLQQHDAAAMAPTLQMGTRSGLEGGIQGSYYSYREPSPYEKVTGPQLGGIADATLVLPNHMFDTVDFRYAYGRVDYTSAEGTSRDHENSLLEVRDVIGQDFLWDHYALSPYIGLGYRDLYNDSRGTTSLGFAGYQTNSQYLYLPIGVKPQVRINGANILGMNLEYDYLAHGWQSSHLGDTGDSDPTIHTGQNTGFGLRADAMWETATWSVGPFVNYWNVNTSAGKIYNSPNSTCGAATCVFAEPRNMTIEGGLQLKYHFLNF